MTSSLRKSHLGARLAFSSIAIPLLLLTIYFSQVPWFQWIFVFLVGLINSAALWEFYRISSHKGFRPVVGIGIVATFAFAYALYLTIQLPSLAFLSWGVCLLALFALFAYYLFQGQAAPLLNMGITILGFVYITLPLSAWIVITYFFPKGHTQDGRWWLFYLLAVTKITDTAAYFCGKMWGRIPFAPRVSPKKTWEGAIGGLLSAVVMSLIFYSGMRLFFTTPPLALTWSQSLWIALILGMLAQFGDLVESLFKRDTGVKDSNQLPGLGGVLDMVDSLVFTTPFLALFLEITLGNS